jgi:hypothetical protein
MPCRMERRTYRSVFFHGNEAARREEFGQSRLRHVVHDARNNDDWNMYVLHTTQRENRVRVISVYVHAYAGSV